MSFHHFTNALRLRSFLALTVLALAVCVPALAASPGHEVIGEWKFTSVLDGVEITSIDENQAKHLLGQVMTITRRGTRFGSQTCGAPSFDSKLVEPNIYVRKEARMDATKLHLPNPVTVVDMGCTQVFLKKSDQAVIFWDGFFFSARKVNPGKAISR